MGKWTDKGYITHSEWVNDFGGAKASKREIFKKLPFHCCALSLQPWENPFCTIDGTVYDLVHILPWIKQYKSDPVSGKPMDSKSLIKLTFYKSAQGEYHCPITFKVFNEHSHIIAIKSTGNVYSQEAIQTLIIDAKNYRDLINDEQISRADFITIQDPNSVTDKNISEFFHYKNDLKVQNTELEDAKKLVSYKLNAIGTTSKILDEYHSKIAKVSIKKTEKTNTEKALDAHYSTGRMAAALTSTTMTPVTSIETAKINEADYKIAHVKGKGYATFVTNLGDINVELYCQDTPRTCYNLIALAKKGAYKNVKFHRNIKNFMLQGGDPTGTGSGGESIYGKPFKDELVSHLNHDGRGILSMANRGPDTNTSQFFFTYRTCSNLNRKHTVFGKLVGGMDTLTRAELVPSGRNDVPTEDIILKDIIVHVDPFENVMTELQAKDEKEKQIRDRLEARAAKEKLVEQSRPTEKSSTEIGKYMKKRDNTDEKETERQVKQAKKNAGRGFDFSSW